MIKLIRNILTLSLILTFIQSCSVTNNFYMNNPVPMEKGKGEVYAGIGTGINAKIDSVSESNGDVYFSGQTDIAPILSVGFQAGVTKQFDIRGAVYFPFIVGGFGVRLGPQYSFFDSSSDFNMALGVDLGFSVAKDSLGLSGSKSSLDRNSKGSFSSDIFLPFSYKLADHFSIILTPRYSYNSFFILKNLNSDKSKSYGLSYPSLTMGLRIYTFYLEFSELYYNNSFNPHGGICWIIPLNEDQ